MGAAPSCRQPKMRGAEKQGGVGGGGWEGLLRPPVAMLVLEFVGLLVSVSESLLVLVPVLELVPLLEMDGRLELVMPGVGACWSPHLR